MTPLTDLVTKYIQSIHALKYLEELNRNDWNYATRIGWGFTSENGDDRLNSIKKTLFMERLALAEEINELADFPS